MGKRLLQSQIALFFKEPFRGNTSDFSLALKEKLGESNGTQMLEDALEAPPEIPRLILGYPDFNINFSNLRVDMYIKPGTDLGNLAQVHDDVLTKLNIIIGRIGVVSSYLLLDEPDTLKNYLNPSITAGLTLKEVGFRLNSALSIDEYECNNIQSYIVSNVQVDSENKKGVVLNRDINTLPEHLNDYVFNSKVKNFINKASILMDESVL